MSDKKNTKTDSGLTAKEKFIRNNRIDIDYRIEGDQIIIAGRKYKPVMIMVTYMILLFLSVMLIVLSVMRIFRKDYYGIIFIVIGIIGFAIGMLYRYIYKRGKAAIGSKKTDQEEKDVSNNG